MVSVAPARKDGVTWNSPNLADKVVASVSERAVAKTFAVLSAYLVSEATIIPPPAAKAMECRDSSKIAAGFRRDRQCSAVGSPPN